MPGRRRIAAPGDPACPAPDCERPAGFATDHEGDGFCRRHDGHRRPRERVKKAARKAATGARSHRAKVPATPTPTLGLRKPESAPVAGPLARRLTGAAAASSPDPLAVLRSVLASARSAGYTFEAAWAIGAEAALSYMDRGAAEEWWETLSATERAWADAYARRASRLAALSRASPCV